MASSVWAVTGGPQLGVSAPAQTAITTAAVILAANPKRKCFIVQNTDTVAVFLSFGATNPTATAYHIALAACTGANDGTGGIYFDSNFVGVVRGLSASGTAHVVITEFTTGTPDLNQYLDPGLEATL